MRRSGARRSILALVAVAVVVDITVVVFVVAAATVATDDDDDDDDDDDAPRLASSYLKPIFGFRIRSTNAICIIYAGLLAQVSFVLVAVPR
ncbi:hypothetical protein RF55_12064 [Lasius niger]|uniref:Uncharacterized protein n=1 Tax=Lasius niger TaxID=67767 RepID=A0A0J7KE10_LASNI|nr:hypothetical protein RF55_12064 [Lasius niger]